MKVWITKYALTRGIIESEGEELSKTMIRVRGAAVKCQVYSIFPDWWPSKESAILRAEQMRNAKIKSLEKQVEKLKKLKF